MRLKLKDRFDRFYVSWDLRGFPVADVTQIQTGQTAGSSRTQSAWEFLLLLRVMQSLSRDQGLEGAFEKTEPYPRSMPPTTNSATSSGETLPHSSSGGDRNPIRQTRPHISWRRRLSRDHHLEQRIRRHALGRPVDPGSSAEHEALI